MSGIKGALEEIELTVLQKNNYIIYKNRKKK